MFWQGDLDAAICLSCSERSIDNWQNLCNRIVVKNLQWNILIVIHRYLDIWKLNLTKIIIEIILQEFATEHHHRDTSLSFISTIAFEHLGLYIMGFTQGGFFSLWNVISFKLCFVWRKKDHFGFGRPQPSLSKTKTPELAKSAKESGNICKIGKKIENYWKWKNYFCSW